MQSFFTEPSGRPVNDADLMPLSWLSQWGYCPRRFALLAVEQLWTDNAYTAEGTIQHRRVHTARTEKRGDFVAFYETQVFSSDLRLSGFCDCVEAHRIYDASQEDKPLSTLPGLDGSWRLYPVEYKHGVVRRNEEEYHLQLGAQALCLEEMYGGSIPVGAIFYIQDHRRNEIELTDDLRARTREAAASISRILETGTLPAAERTSKCGKCSMINDCMPEIKQSAANYLSDLIKSLSGGE